MSENEMDKWLESSHLAGGNLGYIDTLYEQYLADPSSVPEQWQAYFKGMGQASELPHTPTREAFKNFKSHGGASVGASSSDHGVSQGHVFQLINAYRTHGHHQARLDPLGLGERKAIPDLSLEYHKLSDRDLDNVYSTESSLSSNGATLRAILHDLEKTYCSGVGAEYMHITDPEETSWIAQHLESAKGNFGFDEDTKKNLLKQLTMAEGLERYLHTKYVGQKRFSLEGGDSLIPMLNAIVQEAGKDAVKELIIGMAHRGRLNVLINIFGKEPAILFDEFEGKHTASEMSGDVKYHMGFSTDINTPNGMMHLVLAFNPSHLEIISPVVQGSVRARQRRRHDLDDKNKVIPVVIHGDAAFAGQGVVMETFNFSQARGYSTGGTVHIVINNQVGFTTSNPLDSRSTLYCTDVAKMVQAPVFHVNGDDPEAVLFVTKLAFEYRMKFKKDVVIDLVCYRRHGHNEADEPSLTQPIMYQVIKKLPTTRELYANKLTDEGVITADEAKGLVDNYRDELDAGHAVVDTLTETSHDKHAVNWQPYIGRSWTESVETKIELSELKHLGKKLVNVPKGFTIHPVVKRLNNEREKMTNEEVKVNWGYAECLAYATLLLDGYNVRISGQDCGRGTFSHRHAVFHDSKTGDSFIPLANMSPDQSQFIIIDSILSEEAVLGFEYGYATAEPNALVIWEAQFGDFANGAQVVIDQFISSGEQKWGRLCGLVMLLPHGYEGQGPEHSSARLERYLQLCGQHNIQVCVPTTPAQVYHMLRRQMIRPFRKPLVVMTPKSLLRHKEAVSSLDELANGSFQLVIPEVDDINPADTTRVVLCSGKVYYDLLAGRRERGLTDTAIIRIEQLYPFPEGALKAILAQYKKANTVVWCQEEPKNQGAWYASQHHMRTCLRSDQRLKYAGREFFAAPAVGYSPLHAAQQKELVEQALTS